MNLPITLLNPLLIVFNAELLKGLATKGKLRFKLRKSQPNA